jgi:hypothetical protein
MFLARIPKKPKRSDRWKSQSHLTHVRKHACVNCGSITNIQAAHVRMGSGAGIGRKPDDWRAVPLCGGSPEVEGCHREQHRVGEPKFWGLYESLTGHDVEEVIDELIRTSPKRREIEEVMRERNRG